MDEHQFVILRRVKSVPTLAGCAQCGRKFFTPAEFEADPVGAEFYLFKKFEAHKCPQEEAKRMRRAS
jgi:hypothetical protein